MQIVKANQLKIRLINGIEIWKKFQDEGKEINNFRLSTKTSKESKHLQKKLEIILSKSIRQATNLKVNLKKPDVEVYVNVSPTDITIGFPLTKTPLSNRPYIKHIGLRSTVAHILCKLIEPKPEDVIIDPMCGYGTILCEMKNYIANTKCSGYDINEDSIAKAVENAGEFDDLKFQRIDIKDLSLADDSVDGVVCDIPFGQKHLSVDEAKELLPRILQTILKILKQEKLAAILLSPELRKSITSKEVNGCTLTKISEDSLKLGETWAYIIVFKKTQNTD
ncbi:DgyrCDS12243 [Dimorphilus gyrociliatus]|uniref:DgyrCDS12243 n=1 Tax=Dimorphilus gyrociliatus TaxID=2664684 RepID=A0A7I8W6P9_9ANNE|nr:DgyrCDS12243 [Dimorphilus gyrociliatus]